jgi:hypothetical protein
MPPDAIEEGTPANVPDKEPDDTLELTDEGLEMPEFLKGYVGEFEIRTPSITAELETTAAGLPEDDYYDGIIVAYPDDGDYHGDLREGLMGISTDDHRETVFEIIDKRTKEGADE